MAGRPRTARHVGAVVIDCDGRVANDLLVRRQALAEDSPEGTLAHEVVEADTLVLVIDASAPPAQVEADFAEFDRFLRQMEISRGQRAEVGGLPVFLVLTKCDLLAQPSDKAADWMERIEQHKRDVDTRFRNFLARREQESGPLPFGRLDLHLWATAIKRPALAGSAAKAREPYGVAELFRQCLEEAAAFRGRRRQSGRRLLWTVGGATGIVALMASLAVAFTVQNLDTQANALKARVDPIVFADLPSPAERLRGPIRDLRARADEYATIRNDPQFSSLPPEQQQLVRDRLDELLAYLAYFDRLRQSPRPQDVHTEKALSEIKERLRTELKLPRADWSADRRRPAVFRSRPGRRRAGYRRQADAELVSRQRGKSRQPVDVQRTADRPGRGRHQLGFLDARGRNPAQSRAATALRRVQRRRRSRHDVDLRRDGVAFRRAAERAHELGGGPASITAQSSISARALGLASAVDKRPPVLVIPRQFTLEQASQRRKTLLQYYPNYQSDFILDRVPDAIRGQVRQVAHTTTSTYWCPRGRRC